MATRQQVQQVAQAVKSDMQAAVAAATARFALSPAFASADARSRLENGAVGRLGQLQRQNPALFEAYARSIGAQPNLGSVSSTINRQANGLVNDRLIGGSAPRAASAGGGRSSGS